MKTFTKLVVAGAAVAIVALTGTYVRAQHGHGFGQGRMGMGLGMMSGAGMGHGSATSAEHGEIRDLFMLHDRIKRTVINLPDGIKTVTESDDPELAKVIISHVIGMGERVKEGRDPGLPIESPALHSIFRDKDKIKSTYETTEKGVIVVQTSSDPQTIAALQQHATEVSDLAQRGMPAAHEAMMKNAGGMLDGHGMAPDMHK